MARIRIITDITAQLSPEVVEKYQITVLPLEIQYGDKTVTLRPNEDPETLYQHMIESSAQPSAATIPAKAFQEAYSQLNREADDILVIVSSSLLSNGHATARTQAQAFLGQCRITVMDSLSVSKGLGLLVEAAAKAAQEGQTLDNIVRLIRGMLPHIYMIFVVDRLDYLEQGDRLGAAQSLLGTILRIKPLLLVEDGEILPVEKMRTQTMALEKLSDFVGEFATIQKIYILRGTQISDDDDIVKELEELLSLVLPEREFPIIEYDPLLTCHLGPSALGVAVYEGL
jgi:DegV family protein with EDD domain